MGEHFSLICQQVLYITLSYNTEIAGLYKKCALFFLLTGILFVVFPIAGIGLLVFDCSVGIYLAYRFYKGILKRYS